MLQRVVLHKHSPVGPGQRWNLCNLDQYRTSVEWVIADKAVFYTCVWDLHFYLFLPKLDLALPIFMVKSVVA